MLPTEAGFEVLQPTDDEPAARGVMGVTQKTAQKIEKVMDKANLARGEVKLAEEAGDTAAFDTAQQARTAAKREVDKTVTRAAADAAEKAMKIPQNLSDWTAVAHGVMSGDITGAALIFGLGRGVITPVYKTAVKKLLSSENAVKWLASNTEGLSTPAQVVATLPGLPAEKWVTPDQRRAIGTITGATEKPQNTLGGRPPGMMRLGGPDDDAGSQDFHNWRDSSGRFAPAGSKGAIDHSALEEMMQGGLP